MIYLGPGNSMTYTLFVVANPPDGNYFPLFTVASKDGGSIRYPIKVEVDSQDVRASFDRISDALAISTKDIVNLTIVNPRNGAIRNIMITPEGDGATISPTNPFIQSIAAGSSVDIPFDVTPKKDTSMTFHVSFLNGNNKHTTDVILPIKTGSDKEAAVPVINNIAVTSVGSTYHLTWDVNNAGLSDAKAMVLTVNAPAKPMGPYPEYAIGSLASDDFSGFELNFAANDLSAVPLQIQWKDAGGNSFTTVKMFDIRELLSGSTAPGTKTGSSSGSGTTAASGTSAARTGGPQDGGLAFGIGGSRAGGLSSFYPVIAGIVILIIAIVLWMKRKWITGKFRKQ